MDIDKIKNEITSSHFLSTFITVFIILYIFTSLINFLGSYPMLIILSGIITYYINCLKLCHLAELFLCLETLRC